MEADPISSYPTPTTSYAQARRNNNNLWKVLFAFQEKHSSPVPVKSAASLSWDPFRSAGAHPEAALASWPLAPPAANCKTKAQDAFYKVNQPKAQQKRSQPSQNTHSAAGNIFTQSNLSTTWMPNLQGTPESHLHVAWKKPGKWCSILTPGPYWEATDSFQDKKKHLGILFNMETWYLNLVPEDLGWTFRFWVPAVSW